MPLARLLLVSVETGGGGEKVWDWGVECTRLGSLTSLGISVNLAVGSSPTL